MVMAKTAICTAELEFGLRIGADDFIRACQKAAN